MGWTRVECLVSLKVSKSNAIITYRYATWNVYGWIQTNAKMIRLCCMSHRETGRQFEPDIAEVKNSLMRVCVGAGWKWKSTACKPCFPGLDFECLASIFVRPRKRWCFPFLTRSECRIAVLKFTNYGYPLALLFCYLKLTPNGRA